MRSPICELGNNNRSQRSTEKMISAPAGIKAETLKGGAGVVITVHCWYAPTPVVLPGSSPPQGLGR